MSTHNNEGKKHLPGNEKRRAEMAHCKSRFMERWGIDLTDEIRDMMDNQIRTGESIFIEHKSNRVSIHEVYYDFSFYRVVYDKIREAMITVLPKQKAKKKKGGKKKNLAWRKKYDFLREIKKK